MHVKIRKSDIWSSFSIRFLFYLFAALLFAYFGGLSFCDDGLRHIAFAAHSDIMRSWGEVFPHSLFFKEYDPWWAWHGILRFYLHFFSYETVHIAVNSTVYLLLFLLLDRLLVREGKFRENYLTVMLVLMVVSLSSVKYINLRPDLLSGLFLMAGLLLRDRFFWLFALTVLYGSSYYLFFLYTGSLALTYLLIKERRSFAALFLGSMVALLVHLYVGGSYFVKTVFYLLSDQSLREGLGVSEGAPLFGFLANLNYFVLVALLLGGVFYLAYRYNDYFKRRPLALLLLVTSPLWVAQVRYLYLLKPLFLILFLMEFWHLAAFLLSRGVRYYLRRFVHILKTLHRNILLTSVLLIYTAITLGAVNSLKENSHLLKRYAFYKDKSFDNKTILLNTLSSEIYFALYLNPTLHFVPSCSIGWFEQNRSMKDLYIKMQKKEGIDEFQTAKLARYVGASYYIHIMHNPEGRLSFAKLKKAGIVPIAILHDRIIFKIKKESK